MGRACVYLLCVQMLVRSTYPFVRTELPVGLSVLGREYGALQVGFGWNACL